MPTKVSTLSIPAEEGFHSPLFAWVSRTPRLVWGKPGASTARHGHAGDEIILVLEGHLKDDRGSYGPGGVCRSSAGDVHQEQVLGEDDCICFAVYYGELIPV